MRLIESRLDSLVGQTVKGRYRVIKELGRGGMGTVYLAEQVSMGRKVALKVLHEKVAWDEEFVQRFHREARLTAALNHPHVITIHDFDQAEGGSLFIAMEYVDGRTLRQVIQGGPLGFAKSVRLGIQIAEGLGAAHRVGVIHRDVKPENILVSRDVEQAKLTDLGIARLRDMETATKLTQTGMIMGTPAYMAPEQIEGREVSAQTDIYAFGIMLYEMISGNTPFTATTSTALLMKHVSEPPVPLRKLCAEVPLDFERLVMQALEKKPERRPRDMDEVVSELRKLEASLTQEFPGTVSVPKLARPKQATVLFAGVLILITSLVVVWGIETNWKFPLAGSSSQIDALVVQVPKTEINVGETVALKARARYGDGKEIEVGKEIQWASSNPSLLTISPEGQGQARLPGEVDINARVGNVISPTARINIIGLSDAQPKPQPQIISLAVESDKQRLVVKDRARLQVKARFSDGTIREIVNGVDWRSTDNSVANINARGELEALKEGKAAVTARFGGAEAEALLIEVQSKRAQTQRVPAGKPPLQDHAQPLPITRQDPVATPSHSPGETSPQSPSVGQAEETTVAPSRDPRDVISEYIRGEKQRRGR